MYCADKNHRSGSLCKDCKKLADYANDRLQKCHYGYLKPTCLQCTIHCYSPVMKKKIIEVMRYAGPRMVLRHPVLSFFYLKNKFFNRANNKMQKKGDD